ncbi:MAG: hypothetical protein IPL23_18285 [Saprospiraceae bacterium]|nr:hypothetical protein [Saprospiraceae bacterium]
MLSTRLIILLLICSSVLFSQDSISSKKWEILVMPDVFNNQYVTIVQKTKNKIDISSQPVSDRYFAPSDFYRTNSTFLISRKIKNNAEILLGINGVPNFGLKGNYFYLGARFIKQNKFLEFKYALGMSIHYFDASLKQYGLKSTFSTVYPWRDLLVVFHRI